MCESGQLPYAAAKNKERFWKAMDIKFWSRSWRISDSIVILLPAIARWRSNSNQASRLGCRGSAAHGRLRARRLQLLRQHAQLSTCRAECPTTSNMNALLYQMISKSRARLEKESTSHTFKGSYNFTCPVLGTRKAAKSVQQSKNWGLDFLHTPEVY